MAYYSQLDLRWSHVKIGASKSTLGRFGCTTTAICELGKRFGSTITPEQYAHNAANYTKDLIRWERVQSMIPELHFDWRERPADEAHIREVLKYKNRGVLLEVNNGAHWVLATKPTLLGGDFVAIDPLGGVEIQVKKKYKNITKAVYFTSVKTVPTTIPADLEGLTGTILIVPEQAGRLYYIDLRGHKHDLGSSPKDVVGSLGKLAKGISVVNLDRIPD